MKASFRTHYCKPESLEIREIPLPEPQANEILVQVKASTINRTDLGVLTGKPYAIRAFAGLSKPKIPVTGTDFAGIVTKVGSAVSDLQPGDRVWGFDDNGAGTHGEYVAYPIQKAHSKIPDGVDFQTIVACGEAAHYAINFINKVGIRPGMSVLVNGGTGAIGSAAIQILNSMGAEVSAVCFEEDIEIVSKLGPDRVIGLEQVDFTKEKILYDFVFDAVGKSRFSLCRPILKPNGIYISSELGPGWENIGYAWRGFFSTGKKVIFPLPSDIPGSMDFIQRLVLDGKFQPLIDEKSFDLERVSEGFCYVATGKKKGNVILKIS